MMTYHTTSVFSRLRGFFHLPGLAVATLGMASPAHGAVLLVVDVENPSAVTITATSSPALLNDATGAGGDGVTMLLFFIDQGFQLVGDEVSGVGLSAAGMTESYSDVSNTFALLTARDINFYRIDAGTQAFSMLTPAFNGSMVLDLWAATGLLPSVGTIGDILVGDTVTGSGAVIGQWQVVPEPGAALLAGIGMIMAAASRRRMH